MNKETMQTDVLCIGGGVAGMMAAIRASELGADVMVVDKANPVRSGSAAVGCDHFRCYIPEVHGPDIKPLVDQLLNSARGAMRDRAFAETWLERSFEIVKLWDGWGIPMRYNGRYEFAGHGFPGQTLTGLKYSGKDQKKVLTREAEKRGVRIVERVMMSDLIPGDDVFLALGVGTREEKTVEVQAKTIVLGTGLTTRLYPSPTPGWMFNLANSPNNTGDGRAMAYRAGAELANVEMTMRWAGPKAFARCGKGSWVGVFRDPEGKPVGPFVNRPNRRYGDVTADVWNSLFEEYAKAGKGPVYMDCRGISEEDYEYMMHFMANEGNAALLGHMSEEKRDIRRDPVEFTTYEMHLSQGVAYNERAETSLKGLYAAGDEFFGAISCAATFGWIAGENAAEYARRAQGLQNACMRSRAGQIEARYSALRERREGVRWQEANIALQQLMADYCGAVRSAHMLRAGLEHIRGLKSKARAMMSAENQHELMHALEVQNLIELGELVMVAAAERRESRGQHIRSDYPLTNPMLNGMLYARRGEKGPLLEWRRLRR